MELAFLVYAISLLNNIGTALIVLGCAMLVIAFFCVLCAEERNYSSSTRKSAWKWAKIWFFTAVLFFCISAFIPSQKTAYMMVGAYAAQKVAENPKTIEMSGKVIKIIESNLDKYLVEGLEEAKKATTSNSKD